MTYCTRVLSDKPRPQLLAFNGQVIVSDNPYKVPVGYECVEWVWDGPVIHDSRWSSK